MSDYEGHIRFGLIGAGRLGGSLALALGDRLRWIISRSEASLAKIRPDLAESVILLTQSDVRLPEVECVILCVGDAAIEVTAKRFARQHAQLLKGTYLVHCSGALKRGVLDSAAALGARTIAAHPFQTFTRASVEALEHVAWGVECESRDADAARAIVRRLKGRPIILTDAVIKRKALYHATAVVASNYLVLLTALARDMAAAGGIEARDFLPPILRTALSNAVKAIENDETLGSILTGPIARADLATLETQAQELEDFPALAEHYAAIGKVGAEIAAAHKLISAEQFTQIIDTFEQMASKGHSSQPSK